MATFIWVNFRSNIQGEIQGTIWKKIQSNILDQIAQLSLRQRRSITNASESRNKDYNSQDRGRVGYAQRGDGHVKGTHQLNSNSDVLNKWEADKRTKEQIRAFLDRWPVQMIQYLHAIIRGAKWENGVEIAMEGMRRHSQADSNWRIFILSNNISRWHPSYPMIGVRSMGTFVVHGKVPLKGENDLPNYLLWMIRFSGNMENAWLG